MTFLPPLQMTDGEAFAQAYIWHEDDRTFDFTGWTGTWEIKRTGCVMLTGTLELTATGDIRLSATAAQIQPLLPRTEQRSFTLMGTVWNATLTNGTRTLKFSAAVSMIHNKTATAPNWAF